MRPRPVILPVAAALSLHASPAQAQPHRVCLYLDIGDFLWDASTPPKNPLDEDFNELREEYGRNEGPLSYPAQRWLARVQDDATGETVFGWDPLDGSGCADVELDDGATTITLEWLRWAAWDDEPETGNQVIGYWCDVSMVDCTLDLQDQVVLADVTDGVTDVIVGSGESYPVDAVLWATTFAEERFASMGEQPLDDTRIYVSYDPADVLTGRTQADRNFGNQPSVIVDGDAWHSKFTIAHEYGHQQTLIASHETFGADDVSYCYDPSIYPMPKKCDDQTNNHTMESHEWQAAAVLEGIASWYAVSAWNDVDLVECGACQPGVRYVEPLSTTKAREYPVPRTSPICAADPPCNPGVGNEWDWLSAFRMFRLSPARPSFRSMFTMLSEAYAAGPWHEHEASDAFWQAFDQAMAAHLGPNLADWRAAASQMELDR